MYVILEVSSSVAGLALPLWGLVTQPPHPYYSILPPVLSSPDMSPLTHRGFPQMCQGCRIDFPQIRQGCRIDFPPDAAFLGVCLWCRTAFSPARSRGLNRPLRPLKRATPPPGLRSPGCSGCPALRSPSAGSCRGSVLSPPTSCRAALGGVVGVVLKHDPRHAIIGGQSPPPPAAVAAGASPL